MGEVGFNQQIAALDAMTGHTMWGARDGNVQHLKPSSKLEFCGLPPEIDVEAACNVKIMNVSEAKFAVSSNCCVERNDSVSEPSGSSFCC